MKKCLILVVIMYYSLAHVNASNPEWVQINDFRTFEVKFSNGSIWTGTEKNGLIKINLESKTTSIFNTSNSPVPNRLHLFEFDTFNNIWLPQDSFFLMYDKQNWSKVNYDFYHLIEDSQNSYPQSFAIDKYNNKWIGTTSMGLFKFGNNVWKNFNRTNSVLPMNWVKKIFADGNNLWINAHDILTQLDIITDEITIFFTLFFDEYDYIIRNPELFCKDTSGKLWIFNYSTYLLNYDGEHWKYVREEKGSPIKNPELMSMAIDKNNVIWGGVMAQPDNSGIIKYDGTNWDYLKYDVEKFWAYSIAVDDDNHKWFGTEIGLWVYREGGVSNDILSLTSVDDSAPSQTKQNGIVLSPNPATEYIEINPPLPKGDSEFASRGIYEVKIFNMLGECVITTPSLRDTPSEKGNLRIDVSHLPSGVYCIRIGNQTQMFVKM